MFLGRNQNEPFSVELPDSPADSGAKAMTVWSVAIPKDYHDDLILRISNGSVGFLAISGTIRIHPPGTGCRADFPQSCLGAEVEMAINNTPPAVDSNSPDRRPFRIGFLSSMHISDKEWDSFALSSDLDAAPTAMTNLKKSGYVYSPRSGARQITAYGGSNDWTNRLGARRATATMELRMLKTDPASGINALAADGWETVTSDPNNDNIGVTLTADFIPRRWIYHIEAREPNHR